MRDATPSELLVRAVEIQREACRAMGAPFYAGLLDHAAANADLSVPFWSVMISWTGENPVADALPLRVLGALHDLVLAGEEPGLAALYPTRERPGDIDGAWTQLNEVIEKRRAFVAARIEDELQTNEVQRCAALVPGFLEIRRRTGGLPMHLAEVGASSGLNLCWDRHRYVWGDTTWGDPEALLELAPAWTGTAPEAGPLRVISRRGCDIAPIDLAVDANRRRLQSFVWPEQPERLDRLARAIEIAARERFDLVQQTASEFVDDFLAVPRPGSVRVIYHSVMWIYVPEPERKHVENAIHEAGRGATPEAPLAWLRLEHMAGSRAGLFLDYWPGAGDRPELLARSHYHGHEIEWYGPGGAP